MNQDLYEIMKRVLRNAPPILEWKYGYLEVTLGVFRAYKYSEDKSWTKYRKYFEFLMCYFYKTGKVNWVKQRWKNPVK